MNTLPPAAITTAQRIIGAVRDLDADAIAELVAQADAAVIVALAAMIDDTRTPRELLAWTDGGPEHVLEWRRGLTDQQCKDYAALFKAGDKEPETIDGYREWDRRRGLKRRAYRQRKEEAT